MPGYKFKGDKSSIVGIVNSKYNEAYIAGNYLTQAEGDVLHSLKKEGNEYAQLIMLKNKEVNKPATLLSASSNSVSANSFSIVSVKVKVTGNTVAKVRLVEVEPTSEGKFKTITLTTDTESKELITSVKSTDLAIDDGWTEVRFFIASGNKDIEYKVEISLDNEKRDDAIFVNTSLSDITTITTLDTFNSIKQEYVDSAKNLDTLEDFSNPVLHTRAPAKVLTTDENGNDVESQLTFDPQEVFTANNLYVFANFSTVNADEVIDNRSEVEEDTEHDHEHDHEHEDEGYQATTDLGLQISSIVLALALIVVLVVVVIKNNRKNTSDRKVQVKSYYDRNTREKAMENIAKKKAMIDIDADADEEVEEYDYEAAQLVEEEPTEEVESAENVEEQVIDMEEVSTAPIEEVETNETPNEETSTEDSNS